MSDFLNKIKQFVIRYKYTLVSIFLLCIMAFKASTGLMFEAPLFTFFYLLNVAVLIILIHILSKIKYTLIPTILLSIVIAFNAYFAFMYNSVMGMGAIASIFETNMDEAISMAGGNLFAGIVIFGCSIFLTLMMRKELSKSSLTLRKTLIFLSFYLLVILPVAIGARIKINIEGKVFRRDPIFMGQKRINQHAPFLFGNIASVVAYGEEIAKMISFLDHPRVTPEGIVWNEQKERPRKIFLIIGESATRDYYSLYGYDQPTSPVLDSIYRNTSKLHYYKGIASAAMTRVAVQHMLSFSTVFDSSPFFEQKHLIDMANMAGYETIWISSVPKLGFYQNHIGYMASSASYATFHSAEDVMTNDDLNLVPKVERLFKDEENQLFILHLNGSHFSYKDKFDDIDRMAFPGEDTGERNYNRSLHHTDRVVGAVCEIAQRDSSSLVYYVSDHGEIVGKGHGLWLGGAIQYRTPMVTINNGSFHVDSIMHRYMEPETSRISNSSLIYILSECLGYDVPQRYVDKAIEDGKSVLQIVNNSISRYSDLSEDIEDRYNMNQYIVQ